MEEDLETEVTTLRDDNSENKMEQTIVKRRLTKIWRWVRNLKPRTVQTETD